MNRVEKFFLKWTLRKVLLKEVARYAASGQETDVLADATYAVANRFTDLQPMNLGVELRANKLVLRLPRFGIKISVRLPPPLERDKAYDPPP